MCGVNGVWWGSGVRMWDVCGEREESIRSPEADSGEPLMQELGTELGSSGRVVYDSNH